MSKKTWFDVDKDGLAKVLDRRGGKSFVLFELIQNAWDENCNIVDVSLHPITNRPACRLRIKDDSPDGFVDLKDAFVLFADSKKKSNPELRGRFNLGEKLVLACCNHARIQSTTGGIEFLEDGNRKHLRSKLDSGTIFDAEVAMIRSEYEDCCQAVRKLIPPKGIQTFFNGEKLKQRTPVAIFKATLPTEISDETGSLRKTSRSTIVKVYETEDEEIASIYELGIPIVETEDKFHVNVMQKVPTNMDRDNVAPPYLRKIRTLVLNEVHDKIDDKNEANSAWVRDALDDKDCKLEAAASVVKKRFGNKIVAFDPSDPEGTKIAASQGYTVIPGGAFSKSAWNKIKESGAVKPAGQVTPSPKPYSKDGKKLERIPRQEWNEKMEQFADYASLIGSLLLDRKIPVVFVNESRWPFQGTYGPETNLVVNLDGELIDNFPENIVDIDDFLLHEFAHHYERDHLSSKYHEACTFLGAKLKEKVLENPQLFLSNIKFSKKIAK